MTKGLPEARRPERLHRRHDRESGGDEERDTRKRGSAQSTPAPHQPINAMNTKPYIAWKATKEARRERITGTARPYVTFTPAPVEHPQERTLASLARSTDRVPYVRCLLAEAADVARRWA